MICAGAYKVENCKYEITNYDVKISKICIYIIYQYTNCREKHQAITFRYLAKLQA